jgi:hypothetical protein
VDKINIFAFVSIWLFIGGLIQASNIDVSGKWEVNLDSGHGVHTNIAEFEQDGEKIAVIIEGNKGEGTLVDNEIRWEISLKTPMGEMDAIFTGTVEGDNMEGQVEISGMSLPWTGKNIFGAQVRENKA